MGEYNITTKWNSYLSEYSVAKKDIYYTEEYVNLYSTETEKAECFVYTENNKVLLFPFLTRYFSFRGKNYYDIETAYGYGGPIANCEDNAFIDNAINAFLRYGYEHEYVAAFVRFHPLLQNACLCHSMGKVIEDRKTIAIDLRQNIEQVWKEEIHTQNRNVIRKGERNGLRFVADYSFQYLSEFKRLYNGTMDKLSAEEFYYFDDSYYTDLQNNITNRFLGVVLDGEEVISAAIFFYDGIYGHYHLSGSDKSKLRLNPNNFMIWEAAKELKKCGVQYFHLGGGINSDESNNLFLFKKRFSKNVHQFSIGKTIFMPDVYDEICREWENTYPDKVEKYKHFLLKYKY